MVVLVLITNCQVSLKPNKGPVIAQTMITVTASKKVAGRPVVRAAHLAKVVNQLFDFAGRMVAPP